MSSIILQHPATQACDSACARIAFLNSELVQDAVTRNIEIIGEASSNIQRVAPEFAATHDDIPWLVMDTMPRLPWLDKVGLEIVWKTIRGGLPRLYQQVQEVTRGLTEDDTNGGIPA